MNVWTATISDIQPIPNKDRIVLATVNGYQSIVAADHYKVGDLVVYISEQCILTDQLQEELGLTGRLAGSKKDRVKAIKMGGVLSQGIVCRPADWELAGRPEGDLDEFFNHAITKWEPEIPLHMSGKIGRPKGNAPIAPMYDIENIKKQRHQRWNFNPQTGEPEGEPWWYDPFEGRYVIVTEKLHGTNFAVHMNLGDPTVYVYSKGLGKNGHVLLEDETNVYWRALHKYPRIKDFMFEMLMDDMDFTAAITIRGEIIGNGIQDLTYGIDFDLALFAIEFHEHNGTVHNYHPHTWQRTSELGGIPYIPILWEGTYDYDKCVELSVGDNLYGTAGLHVREGVVVSDADQYRQMNGQRYAAKFINPDYLTRKGGTEFN